MNQDKSAPIFVRFDKEMTNIVKGFAILFMMILHCYGSDYDVPLNTDWSLTGYHATFKVCVGMFTFLVGYGYAFSKDKNWKYSLQHIKKLLIPFWVILAFFTLPFCYQQILNENPLTLVYNLFGIDSTYNWYSWFVYFYIFAMTVMPLLYEYIDRKPVLNTVIVILAATLLSVVLHEAPRVCSILFGLQLPQMVEVRPVLALFNCLMMMPCLMLGYLFAKQGYYERIRIDRLSVTLTSILCIVLMIVILIPKFKLPFKMDFLYAPLMIAAIVVLFNKCRIPLIRNVFIKMGEVSVYMWFFHALFFLPAVKWFYQPAITVFNNVNLVVLWTIMLTFFASWFIKTIIDAVLSGISASKQ